MNSPIVYPIIYPTSSQLRSYNFYLVQDEGSLYLIDAGVNTDECWQLFINVLEKNNFSLKDINHIVLTHHHSDHIGLVNRIISKVNIPVYAHPDAVPRLKRDKPFLQERIAFFKRLYTEMGDHELGGKRVKEMSTLIDKNKANIVNGPILPLKQGDSIGCFTILEVPGHSVDHIALYHLESGILLVGDHLISHIASNALVEPNNKGMIYPSLSAYEQSLNKCNELYLTTVYSGHGRIITNPKELIDRRLKGIERKANRIKKIIGTKQMTAAQITQEYYGRRYEKLFALVMSEIIGQLVRMDALNIVDFEKRNNERYYYVLSDK